MSCPYDTKSRNKAQLDGADFMKGHPNYRRNKRGRSVVMPGGFKQSQKRCLALYNSLGISLDYCDIVEIKERAQKRIRKLLGREPATGNVHGLILSGVLQPDWFAEIDTPESFADPVKRRVIRQLRDMGTRYIWMCGSVRCPGGETRIRRIVGGILGTEYDIEWFPFQGIGGRDPGPGGSPMMLMVAVRK